MEKQRFLEKCRHGIPRFPIECFQTYSDSKHFVVPMHWHKNVEIMQIYKGSAELAIGTGTYSASAGDILIDCQVKCNTIKMKLSITLDTLNARVLKLSSCLCYKTIPPLFLPIYSRILHYCGIFLRSSDLRASRSALVIPLGFRFGLWIESTTSAILAKWDKKITKYVKKIRAYNM